MVSVSVSHTNIPTQSKPIWNILNINLYKLYQKSSWYLSGKDTHILTSKPKFDPWWKLLFFSLSLLPKLHLLGLFYNPTNPIFQHFSLTLAADVLPFPSLVVLFLPISIFLSCLCFSLSSSCRRFSLSLSITFQYASLSFFLFYYYYFFFCVCYFAWCLVFGWWENMGQQRGIYIFSYSSMFSEYIHDFEFFFFSKKLETTGSWPNQTDWNPISLVSVFLPYGSVEKSHFKLTKLHRLYP